MKQISPTLLIHCVVYKAQTGIDRNRNPIYSEVTLDNVRVEATLQTIQGSSGLVKSDSLTLIIDKENSSAIKDGEKIELVIPKENDVITWNEKNYTIKRVTICYAKSSVVHHWELELE